MASPDRIVPEGFRRTLSFRMINRRGSKSYDPALQRHHLLPGQLLSMRCFASIFEAVGQDRLGFDDFRRNGLLLPAREEAVRRLRLPLHRGPHRDYNAMVIERVGGIERRWSRERLKRSQAASDEACARLAQLQRGLRLQLLDVRQPLRLNRKDPLGAGLDFTCLDALAELLWSAA